MDGNEATKIYWSNPDLEVMASHVRRRRMRIDMLEAGRQGYL